MNTKAIKNDGRLDIRINRDIKRRAEEKLTQKGIKLSDYVRIMITQVANSQPTKTDSLDEAMEKFFSDDDNRKAMDALKNL